MVRVLEGCNDGRPDAAERALTHRLRQAGNAAKGGCAGPC